MQWCFSSRYLMSSDNSDRWVVLCIELLFLLLTNYYNNKRKYIGLFNSLSIRRIKNILQTYCFCCAHGFYTKHNDILFHSTIMYSNLLSYLTNEIMRNNTYLMWFMLTYSSLSLSLSILFLYINVMNIKKW